MKPVKSCSDDSGRGACVSEETWAEMSTGVTETKVLLVSVM